MTARMKAPVASTEWKWSCPLRPHLDEGKIVLAWFTEEKDVGLYLGQGQCPVTEEILDRTLAKELRKLEGGEAEVLATEYVAKLLAPEAHLSKYLEAWVFETRVKARAFAAAVQSMAGMFLCRAQGKIPLESWELLALEHGWRPPKGWMGKPR